MAAAQGHHFADRIEDLPGRKRLAAACAERIEVLDRCLRRQSQTAAAAVAGLEAKVAHQTDKAAQAQSTETERQKALDALESDGANTHHHALGALGYVALLACLTMAEYPTVISSLRSSFLAPWAVKMIAVALSIVIAACAHVVGTSLRAAVAAGDKAIDKESANSPHKHDRATNLVIVVLITVSMLGVMYFMYQTRSNLFAGTLARRKADGLRVNGLDPHLLSILMFSLQTLLFSLATVVAFHRAAGSAERQEAGHDRRRRKHIMKAAKAASKAAGDAGSSRDSLAQQLESTRQQVTLVNDDLRSFRSQESQLLLGLNSEHDASFESAKHRRDPLERDPVVFGGAAPTEFSTQPNQAGA